MAAAQRRRTTIRATAPHARLSPSSRCRRGQSSRGPTAARTTGRSVVATATLTSAMKRPAIPMLRTEGTGTATSASSEIATVEPLKTTAAPPCSIARRTATSFATAPS
jgi:hypothetical protein